MADYMSYMNRHALQKKMKAAADKAKADAEAKANAEDKAKADAVAQAQQKREKRAPKGVMAISTARPTPCVTKSMATGASSPRRPWWRKPLCVE